MPTLSIILVILIFYFLLSNAGSIHTRSFLLNALLNFVTSCLPLFKILVAPRVFNAFSKTDDCSSCIAVSVIN